jgi:hypothetical protein
MKKRGSHVGFILSFALFVTFLLFAIAMLLPKLRVKQDNEMFLDYLKLALEQMFVGEINTMVINVTGINPTKDCAKITNIVPDLEEEGIDETKLLIKDENEEVIKYFAKDNALYIDIGQGASDKVLKFYYSEELSNSYCPEGDPGCPSSGGCEPVNKGYTIRITRVNNETFGSKIEEIADWYMESPESYEELKDALNLPPGMVFEFSFIFENNQGYTVTAEYEVPSNQNVFVMEIPILYFDEWANLSPGTLVLKIWEEI